MTTEELTGTQQLRRLAWAGVEIRLDATRLLIDALENVEGMAPVLGPPKRPMAPRCTGPDPHCARPVILHDVN